MRISDWSSDVCSSDLHRQIAALRRRSAGPQLSLSLEAADARGIAEGDPVEIRTAHGRIQAAARLDNKLHGDVVVGELGWWQACDDLGDPAYPITGSESANYNLLASTRNTDPVSNAPELDRKSTRQNSSHSCAY